MRSVALCNFCGEVADNPYTCSYCGRKHCSGHRLPENHDCTQLLAATPPSTSQARKSKRGRSAVTSKLKDVTPGTVGSTEEPDYPSSPPVQTRQRTGKSTSNGELHSALKRTLLWPFLALYGVALYTLKLIVSLVRNPILVALVGILAFTLLATGTISAEDFIGPSGEPVDGAAQDVGSYVSGFVANVSSGADSTTTQTETQASSSNSQTSEYTEFDRGKVERLVHEEINRVRANRSLSTLEFDTRLQEVARDHSQAMADTGYIYHSGPGGDLQDRFDEAGYECRVEVSGNQYSTGGENVAKTWYQESIVGGGYHDTPEELAKALVTQWMNSEGHRENILRDYWQNEGIGIAVVEENGKTAVYATQVFC